MKTYKIEVKLNKEQEVIYDKTVSACRFVYNLYVKKNEEAYRSGNGFIAAFAFDKWLNNEYIPNHIEYAWIKDVSSKAIKSTIISGEKNYKMFFKGIQGRPKCKKASRDTSGYHFVRTGSNRIIRYSRNRIRVR